MKLGDVLVEVEGLIRLLEGDTLDAIKRLPQLSLDLFCEFLFTGFEDGGLKITPTSYIRATRSAGDSAVLGLIWDGEFIAAALSAANRNMQLTQRNSVAHSAIVQTFSQVPQGDVSN